MENISPNITYKEATASRTASLLFIDNTPNAQALAKMKVIAMNVFEPLRAWYGKAIPVSSFYRSTELNKAIGGVSNSQHILGEAMDLDAGSRDENLRLFKWIKNSKKFDQLIWEKDGAWVHVSYKISGNRGQVINDPTSAGLDPAFVSEPDGMSFFTFIKNYWWVLFIGVTVSFVLAAGIVKYKNRKKEA